MLTVISLTDIIFLHKIKKIRLYCLLAFNIAVEKSDSTLISDPF